jgi:UDP-N-acetylglucosamine/UDP-N-acetylgalactosamine diphosphorylase
MLPNGIKFEYAIPDALELASHFLLIEGKRECIFSPRKNAQGSDSPQTCYQNQLKLFVRWLTRAGVEIPLDHVGLPPFAVEISPLFADNEKTFLDKWSTLDPKPFTDKGIYIE